MVTGNAGFVFHTKLKKLKDKIKLWVKDNFDKVERKINSLEGLLFALESEEDDKLLAKNEFKENHQITLELKEALKSEDLLWLNKARWE